MPTILPSNASQNITGGYTYIKWVQQATSDIFVPLMVLAGIIILFMNLRGTTTTSKAFLGSFFIGTIIAILLSTLGLFASTYMYMMIVLTAIAAVWVFVESRVE